MELEPAHVADVAGLAVRRSLPRRGRRTVGAWCFADHFGPTPVEDHVKMRVGPHPHTGLYTVTWLLEGAELHTDSLGSEQLIRPGELNLMTAGHGVAHAEQTPEEYQGVTHGVQLWVAQPEHTRHGPAAFEHHAALPQVTVGQSVATVLIGSFLGETSPARAETPLIGLQLELTAGRSVIPLDPSFEHALLPLDATVRVDGQTVGPDVLAHVDPGVEVLVIDAPPEATIASPVHALLLGGEPFEEKLLMWWNFVVRTRREAESAVLQWNQSSDRFGSVASDLRRIAAPVPTWSAAHGPRHA